MDSEPNALFPECERTNMRGKLPAQKEYTYLLTSARPEAQRVRTLVTDWFGRLPAEERGDWRGRFCSDDDSAHCGAFFELLLHEWLFRLGYKIELHPVLAGSAKRPDFRVSHADGRSFYLEARSTDGNGPDDARTERFCAEVTQTIADIPSSDFFVFIHITEEPTSQPALGELRNKVSAWLQSLDYDTIAAEAGQFSIELEVGGGRVLLTPHAKGSTRGRAASFGGVMIGGATIVDTQATIQRAFRRKASRYGNIDAPFVVAINDLSEYWHEEHAYDSLFGREMTVVTRDGDVVDLRRDTSGLFGSAANPRHTRVSGALIVPGVGPWEFARRIPIFIAHPFAKYPAGALFGTCAGHVMSEGELIETVQRPCLGEIFSLPSGWPESADSGRA